MIYHENPIRNGGANGRNLPENRGFSPDFRANSGSLQHPPAKPVGGFAPHTPHWGTSSPKPPSGGLRPPAPPRGLLRNHFAHTRRQSFEETLAPSIIWASGAEGEASVTTLRRWAERRGVKSRTGGAEGDDEVSEANPKRDITWPKAKTSWRFCFFSRKKKYKKKKWRSHPLFWFFFKRIWLKIRQVSSFYDDKLDRPSVWGGEVEGEARYWASEARCRRHSIPATLRPKIRKNESTYFQRMLKIWSIRCFRKGFP